MTDHDRPSAHLSQAYVDWPWRPATAVRDPELDIPPKRGGMHYEE